MIIQFICRAILLAVPMLYGTTGEIVTELAKQGIEATADVIRTVYAEVTTAARLP